MKTKKKKLKITGTGYDRRYYKDENGKMQPKHRIILNLEGEIPHMGLGLKEIAQLCLKSE